MSIIKTLIDDAVRLQKENRELSQKNMTLNFERAEYRLLCRYLWGGATTAFKQIEGKRLLDENIWLEIPVANYYKSKGNIYK